MKAFATLLVFGGYMLVYAAVAHGGEFATEPWAGLFADAYAGTGAIPQSATTARVGKAQVAAGEQNPNQSKGGVQIVAGTITQTLGNLGSKILSFGRP